MKRPDNDNAIPDELATAIGAFRDGLLIPLAVMTVLATAGVSRTVVIGTGATATLAGALLLCLAHFWTHKQYLGRVQDMNADAQRKFYEKLGLPGPVQEEAISEQAADEQNWQQFLERFGLAPADALRHFRQAAVITFIVYNIAGLLMVTLYLLFQLPYALIIAAGAAVVLLGICGLLRAAIFQLGIWQLLLREMLTGLLLTGAAWLIGSLFRM